MLLVVINISKEAEKSVFYRKIKSFKSYITEISFSTDFIEGIEFQRNVVALSFQSNKLISFFIQDTLQNHYLRDK